MNILFVHPKPARIGYKHMAALSKLKDMNVYLLCGQLGSDVLSSDAQTICKDIDTFSLKKYPYFYKIYRKKIKEKVKEWSIDLIQTYSQPDDAAVATVEAKPGVPIVFCNRDNVSAYTKELLATRIVPRRVAYNKILGAVPRWMLYRYIFHLEKKAHEESDARMYVSPGMFEYSAKHHKVDCKNLVYTDWVLDEEVVKKSKKKLSKGTDEIHLGFSGTIVVDDNYRNHLPFLNRLATGKIHVHMHIVTHDKKSKKECKELEKINKNIHLYDTLLPAPEFIKHLSGYDWGLIPFEAEFTYIDTLLTNKVYDYISARVPIISSDIKTLKNYLKDEKLGFVYKDIDDLRKKLETKTPSEYKVNPKKYLMSKNIHKMIKFYEEIINVKKI